MQAAVHSPQHRAPFQAGPYVAHLVQILTHPGALESGRVGTEFVVAGRTTKRRIECRLGRQHAGLHRVLAALDPRQVHEAGSAANQGSTGKGQLGHRLQPALVDHASPVGDPPGYMKLPPPALRPSGQPCECSTSPGRCTAGSTSHSSLMPMPNFCGSQSLFKL